MSGDYASCSVDNTLNKFNDVIMLNRKAHFILISASIASSIRQDEKSPCICDEAGLNFLKFMGLYSSLRSWNQSHLSPWTSYRCDELRLYVTVSSFMCYKLYMCNHWWFKFSIYFSIRGESALPWTMYGKTVHCTSNRKSLSSRWATWSSRSFP